jgi:hypothetical protein
MNFYEALMAIGLLGLIDFSIVSVAMGFIGNKIIKNVLEAFLFSSNSQTLNNKFMCYIHSFPYYWLDG